VDVVIVDQLYASDLAYTIGEFVDSYCCKVNADADADTYVNIDIDIDIDTSISFLSNNLPNWPKDLNLAPDIMLILDIDPMTRQ